MNYHNLYNFASSHPGTPKEVDAVYILHLLFEYFNQGIVRTYMYEFLDQREDEGTDIEMHFGIIRADGTPKPAFYAIKNMIALLNDNESSFTPAPLEFSLTPKGLPASQDIRYTLLQKTDGNWWIAVFRNASIYDLDLITTRICNPVKVTLALDETAKGINLYKPNVSQDKQETFTNQQTIEFNLAEELILIEIGK